MAVKVEFFSLAMRLRRRLIAREVCTRYLVSVDDHGVEGSSYSMCSAGLTDETPVETLCESNVQHASGKMC